MTQMAISKFLSDAFQENMRCVCVWGGGIHPPTTLNLKQGMRMSDYQSNESPIKFIQFPFLYIPYMPQGIIYNPCSEGPGGLSSSKT